MMAWNAHEHSNSGKKIIRMFAASFSFCEVIKLSGCKPHTSSKGAEYIVGKLMIQEGGSSKAKWRGAKGRAHCQCHILFELYQQFLAASLELICSYQLKWCLNFMSPLLKHFSQYLFKQGGGAYLKQKRKYSSAPSRFAQPGQAENL